MGIFTEAKNKDELILVFDIRSSSVGGALFRAQKSGIPKIIISFREPVALEKNVNADRLLFLTMKSLEIVANKIYMAGLGAPERFFCVLSSPWHISQTRVIKLEKNAPFIFTSKLADSLIEKEISLFEEEYLAKYMDARDTVRSIELKNIKTMLNGYEAPNPLNQKAKELEMVIFISMSGEQILNKIEETIRKHFTFQSIKFSSFTVASFAVVRDMYTKSEDFLLIDIGGEVTDISMIKKSVLRESISFPLGCNFIIRGVASTLKSSQSSSFSEARSILSLFKDGHATESVIKKIGPVINKLKSEWQAKFQESLSNLTNDISIPATIYISVNKDLADLFCQIIKTEQFNQYTFTESKFEVVLLNAEIFRGMVSFEKNTILDPGLLIDSIYINRFLINSTLPR